MKYVICAVRDRAADVFAQPMFVPTLGIAIRSFSDEVNRAEASNMLNKHAEDFDLYELGSYNDADGSFDTHAPRQVCVGKDVLRKEIK